MGFLNLQTLTEESMTAASSLLKNITNPLVDTRMNCFGLQHGFTKQLWIRIIWIIWRRMGIHLEGPHGQLPNLVGMLNMLEYKCSSLK
ncbi:hypothetical protein AMTR_s00077p00078500 [Amborella trichopoda]|uniref:Uncharacterized protein n=1 Tax=Amborella trichopoda TaxID=13333 RepID=W1P2S7_AMBTC|nr:hypothetical protein AMTR_s00077p00078500 [Amborella trichopoda]